MKKLALIALLVFGAAISLQFAVPSTAMAARKKVNCAKVMEELGGGKKVADVAKDLKISRSSVYRCRRAANKSAGKIAKAQASPAATPEASKK
ncbi:MAG TPA: hypothetical protein VFB33_08125 [Candidatus Binataceae bacterium]|jgi:transposase|nr:hypothetical protein [Candidatus Binataceae bacterium]